MACIDFHEPDWKLIPTIVDQKLWSVDEPRDEWDYWTLLDEMAQWGTKGERKWLDDRGAFVETSLGETCLRDLKRSRDCMVEVIDHQLGAVATSSGQLFLLCGCSQDSTEGFRFRFHRLDLENYPEDAGLYLQRNGGSESSVFSRHPGDDPVAFVHFGRTFQDSLQVSVFHVSSDTSMLGGSILSEKQVKLVNTLDRIDGPPEVLAIFVDPRARWSGILLITEDPLRAARRLQQSRIDCVHWGYFTNCERNEIAMAKAQDLNWTARLLEREWKVEPSNRQMVLQVPFRRASLRRTLTMTESTIPSPQRETRARTAHCSPIFGMRKRGHLVLRCSLYQPEFSQRNAEELPEGVSVEYLELGLPNGTRCSLTSFGQDPDEHVLPDYRETQDLNRLEETLRADLKRYKESDLFLKRSRRKRKFDMTKMHEKEVLKKHWCIIMGMNSYDYRPPFEPDPAPFPLAPVERNIQNALLTSTPQIDHECVYLHWFFATSSEGAPPALGVFQLRMPLALAWHGVHLGDLFEGTPEILLFLRDCGMYIAGLGPDRAPLRVELDVPIKVPMDLRLRLSAFRFHWKNQVNPFPMKIDLLVKDVCQFMMISGHNSLQDLNQWECLYPEEQPEG